MYKEISEDFTLDDLSHGSRWGYLDTKFTINNKLNVEVTGKRYLISGYEMPYLIPFVEDVLSLPFNFDVRPEAQSIKVPPPIENDSFIRAVNRQYTHKLVFTDKERLIHSHGQATADEVMKVVYYGKVKRVADAVFYCRSQEDIVSLISLAKKHDVCLVPYGGGTSVSCSLSLPQREKRMIVVVNLTKMARIINVDQENHLVTVEAGIGGEALEKEMNKLGYTLGHEPDSMEFSTVGGWISTNASGMKKNRYGNIEELVNNYILETPAGRVELCHNHARTSSGVSLHKAFFGQEGNFGFITQATLKIFKLPQVKQYQSIILPDFSTGIKLLKELNDETALPASIRLVDNLQFRFGRSLRREDKGLLKRCSLWLQNFVLTKIKGYDLSKLVVATIVFEGVKEQVDAQRRIIARLIKKYQGMFGGATNGERGYMLTYAIAYIRDFMADHYILGETYETTVPWDKIEEMCNATTAKAQELHKKFKFPGTCYVSPRITQVYQNGVCVYFTHGLCYKGVPNPEEKCSAIEKTIRQTIMEHGGSISHHHGIGKIRAEFSYSLYTPKTISILKQLKEQIDPTNIMGVQNNIFYKAAKPIKTNNSSSSTRVKKKPSHRRNSK